MGLDITAYSGLAFALPGNGRDAQGDILYDDGYFHLFFNRDFPGQCSDLPAEAIGAGYARRMGFRAGSYSGYNQWREKLAELAGYPPVAEQGARPSHSEGAWLVNAGPFHELINFSDCEGTIGPACSAKLALDFARFQDAADAHPDSYFREKYADWRQAFEMAALGGAVCFH